METRRVCPVPSAVFITLLFLLVRSGAESTPAQPEMQPGPSEIAYWDAVYAESAHAGVKSFGRPWQGLNWTALRKATRHNIHPQDRVLVLGAGDAGLPEEIFDAGCRGVTAVDFSPVLVAAMAEQSHGVLWRVEDATKLSFQDDSFNAVLDIGLLDAVGAAGDEKMSAAISEAFRVLDPSGTYISASTEPPLYRLPLLEHHFGANATKVLFVPRPRGIDHRVRRIDPALDMGMLSIYVSAKKSGMPIEEQTPTEAQEEEQTPSEVPKEEGTPTEVPGQVETPSEAPKEEHTPSEVPKEEGTPTEVPGQVETPSEVPKEEQTHVEVPREEQVSIEVLTEEQTPAEASEV